MGAGCEEAARVVQGQGVVDRVHVLVASTDTPAAAAGGGTAALLRNTCLLPYAGFAMTAKPSVNLLLLLQVTPLSISLALSSMTHLVDIVELHSWGVCSLYRGLVRGACPHGVL